jgi:hypothetical protein
MFPWGYTHCVSCHTHVCREVIYSLGDQPTIQDRVDMIFHFPHQFLKAQGC